MDKSYDIVIHGAGISGLALALSLVRREAAYKPSVLLLDKNMPEFRPEFDIRPRSVNDFDNRVFALNHAGKKWLESIAVWPGDDSARVFSYDQMYVWDAGGHGQIHFDAAETDLPLLGYIIEGRVLHGWLTRAASAEPMIEMRGNIELESYEEADAELRLHLSSGDSPGTRLLVGADGTQSPVRRLADIDAICWPYHQQAVVTTVETEIDHADTAWQRFLPEGPLAFLPMQKPWCSIVWSVPERRARFLCDMPKEQFAECLMTDFEGRLGQIRTVGARARFPLKFTHASRYTANRVALVADAAHTVHPLAGQGLNLGLLDVSALSRQITEAIAKRQDIGSRRVLRTYERSRKGDNWLMQGSFDAIKRLFSNKQPALAYLRNAGLNIVDGLAPVKNVFMRKAIKGRIC